MSLQQFNQPTLTAALVARILSQALSNMVTGNEPLMAKLWDIYMNLPEDQVILMYETTSLFVEHNPNNLTAVCWPRLTAGHYSQ
jgi:hypothetical protein